MTKLPQCMHCSSYTGTMDGKEFLCKHCHKLTDQPEEVWGEKPDDGVPPAARILQTDNLRILLEAYDKGAAPFHSKSEAYDLQPLVEEAFEPVTAEMVEDAEGKATGVADQAAGAHLEERKQALIEAVSDACAPHLSGLAQDIVALIEEYIE